MSSSLKRDRIELLAPAGGAEQLKYALHFGADAVYIAGQHFGLRARAGNFTDEALASSVKFAHEAGKRVFVTINALMHDEDIEPLGRYVAFLQKVQVDAVILSDLGALQVVAACASGLEVHVSTQASVTNYATASMWHSLGAKRIVLARELSLTEIADIRSHVPDDLELEVFVHGAMCMSYSGRCLISNHLTQRDANRGQCTQPCRWKYALVEETRPDRFFPIEEDERGTYLMDSCDLCMIEHIDALLDAGVDSLKIEGRAKGAYYVATVVNAYRRALDGGDMAEILPELDRVSHRPYSTGFFFGPAQQTYDDAQYLQTHDLCATALSCRDGRLSVRQRNRFFAGDEVEVLSPGEPVRVFTVADLRTEWGELVDVANKATDIYTMDAPFELSPDDILRRKREDEHVKG